MALQAPRTFRGRVISRTRWDAGGTAEFCGAAFLDRCEERSILEEHDYQPMK
jgi:hypothetical protein